MGESDYLLAIVAGPPITSALSTDIAAEVVIVSVVLRGTSH